MVSDNLMRGNTISKSAHYFVCHNYQMESEQTEQTLLIDGATLNALDLLCLPHLWNLTC